MSICKVSYYLLFLNPTLLVCCMVYELSMWPCPPNRRASVLECTCGIRCICESLVNDQLFMCEVTIVVCCVRIQMYIWPYFPMYFLHYTGFCVGSAQMYKIWWWRKLFFTDVHIIITMYAAAPRLTVLIHCSLGFASCIIAIYLKIHCEIWNHVKIIIRQNF